MRFTLPTRTRRGLWAGPWLLALAGLLGAAAAMAGESAKTVLVLYSNGRLIPGNVDIERGLRSATTGVPGSPPMQVFSEFLDSPEFSGAEYERTVTAYLRDKYARRPPDVVLAVARESLGFLLRHREALFPQAQLVHTAVFRSYLPAIAPVPAGVVGVMVEYDPAGTIEQALRWHPRAGHLLVVTGVSTRDREWDAMLRAIVPRFEDRVRVEFLTGQPTAAILERLRGLTPETVVYTPGFYRSADGQAFTPRDSAAAMAAVSGAPLYGPFSSFIGTGAVGGWMPGFEAMGRQAGQIVSSLLAGQDPASLTLPQLMPNELHVDWRQARRWGIEERQIPADAVLHFREPGVWEAYRGAVLTAAGVVLLQAAMIAALLLERRRRRAAEAVVQGQRAELAHASRLAVAGELTASIAHEINQPLGAILSNADAAEMILQAGGDRRDDLLRIVGRIKRDDLRASDVIGRLRALLARHAPERLPFDLNGVAGATAALLDPEARRRQVALDFVPAPQALPCVGDAIQVQQVLINLVLNAMDASVGLAEDRCSVAVEVERRAGAARITVRDRGHGIAPELTDRLFDSFVSTKRQGMGLGLSIARTIVQAHGGRIWAENGPRDGARFHVELPLDGGKMA